MSGLFGVIDPVNELPTDAVGRTAEVMTCPADRSAIIMHGSGFAIGCVSKKTYPGEGEILSDQNQRRSCLFTGRLLGRGESEQPIDPITTARKLFVDGASPAQLSEANGPFAAAIWDREQSQLELITDRYGMYPMYLAQHRSATLFAGQIKALLAPGILPVELDHTSVALMLSIGELLDDLTLLRAVRVMPAGSKLILSGDGQNVSRYWRYSFHEEQTDFDSAARRSADLLRQATARICAHNTAVGVPLSGGLDSRVLLAATPDPAKVPSFTWGVRDCRDLRYGAATARTVNSPHRAFEFHSDYLERLATLGVWITEGQLPCTDFHVLPYVESVADRCDVIINGYAGDTLLGGSFVNRRWWQAPNRTQAGRALWQWRDVSLNPAYRSSLLLSDTDGDSFDDARKAFVGCYQDTPGSTPMDAAMSFLLDNRIRRFTSCGNSLMRWRVESDHPFFDNDFLDFVSTIPHSWRFRHRLYLHMLGNCFADVAAVRWQRTGLPAGVPYWLTFLSLGVHRLANRGPLKSLFRSTRTADFAGWMRGSLRRYVDGLLIDERTLDRGMCDPDTLRRIVNDHLESRVSNASLLGSLMSLELFARLFIDRGAEWTEQCRLAPPPFQRVSLEEVPR